jgi:hypothetical protein
LMGIFYDNFFFPAIERDIENSTQSPMHSGTRMGFCITLLIATGLLQNA